MKKKWLVFPVLLLLIASLYLLFPAIETVKESRKDKVNDGAVLRVLEQEDTWDEWLDTTGLPFQVRLRQIEVTNYFFEFIHQRDTQFSVLKVIPLSRDSTAFSWEAPLNEISYNPADIIENRKRAKALQQTMRGFLNNLLSYTSDIKNVYGFEAGITQVRDTAFLSTSLETDTIPGQAVLYQMIEKLEAYALKQGVLTNREPIMHLQDLYGTSKRNYLFMVAIPIDRVVPASGDIVIKRMIRGNLLVADVQGSLKDIYKKFPLFDTYKEDFGYVSPAIPFMMIQKDHRNLSEMEPWNIRFCYPVF